MEISSSKRERMENLDAMKKRGKNPTSLMINMMHIRLAVGYNKRGGGG